MIEKPVSADTKSIFDRDKRLAISNRKAFVANIFQSDMSSVGSISRLGEV
jgi:hypothetical protein